MQYQYRFDAERNQWIIMLDGYELAAVDTEADARTWIAEHGG